MAVRGFQPLYNLAFFERSLLPLPPPKTLLPEMVLLDASFLLLRAKGEGETHVVSMFDRFSFAGFSFLQGRWHWSLADNDLSSLVLEIKLPLSLSLFYTSIQVWFGARLEITFGEKGGGILFIGERERGLELIFQSRRGFRLEKHRTADLYWSP